MIDSFSPPRAVQLRRHAALLLALALAACSAPSLDAPLAAPDARLAAKAAAGPTVKAANPTYGDRGTTSAVVHVASHGVFDARSPMFSGIELVALHDGGRGEDDGRLEAHEVLALTVRSRLVFLSGCETALGPSWSSSFERTEDYVTLARAFLFAGAQNVVATLWRIEDRSAAVLAGNFYRALPGASPAEALAQAQRALIRSDRYRRPC